MMNLHSTSKTCGKSRSLEYKQFETYGNLLSCQLSLNMLHCTEAHFHLVVLLPLPQTFPSPHISYRLSTSSHQVKGNGFSTCVLLELILKIVMLSENNKLVQTFFSARHIHLAVVFLVSLQCGQRRWTTLRVFTN